MKLRTYLSIVFVLFSFDHYRAFGKKRTGYEKDKMDMRDMADMKDMKDMMDDEEGLVFGRKFRPKNDEDSMDDAKFGDQDSTDEDDRDVFRGSRRDGFRDFKEDRRDRKRNKHLRMAKIVEMQTENVRNDFCREGN